jgi:hypothetical protein
LLRLEKIAKVQASEAAHRFFAQPSAPFATSFRRLSHIVLVLSGDSFEVGFTQEHVSFHRSELSLSA